MTGWTSSSRLLAAAAACLLLSGSSCPDLLPTSRGCRTNLECGPYRTCNTTTGLCGCVDSRGCGDGEFCNAVFQCQVVAGCTDNADCEGQGSGLLCNVKTGQCEPSDLCYDDSQCPLGRVCDRQVAACLAGCRDEADCILGSACIRATTADVLGQCRQDACSSNSECRAGYNCDLASNTCFFDSRGPFCGPCQNFSNNECGDDPANYCLIDTGDPAGRSHFCGVDCSQEQGCPSGYECSDVIIVGPPATPRCAVESCREGRCSINTGVTCAQARDCPLGPPGGDCPRGQEGLCAGTTDRACRSDADCEGGSEGACRKASCSGGESAAFGFCSCVVDVDCPSDTCVGADLTDPGNPLTGHCYISGHRCYDNTDCAVIACVGGGCLIGRNCAPAGDRRCQELQEP
jgi:hypothetical protein